MIILFQYQKGDQMIYLNSTSFPSSYFVAKTTLANQPFNTSK